MDGSAKSVRRLYEHYVELSQAEKDRFVLLKEAAKRQGVSKEALKGYDTEIEKHTKNVELYQTALAGMSKGLENTETKTEDAKNELIDLKDILEKGIDVDPSFYSIIGFKPMIKEDKAIENELGTFDPNSVLVMDENDPLDDVLSMDSMQRLKRRQEMFKELVQNIPKTVEAAAEQGLVSLGEMIGDQMLNGGNMLDKGASLILSVVGNMAVALGRLAISIGVTIKGIQAALKTLNPFVAITAGVALIALGSFFKGKAAQISQGGKSGGSGKLARFADGGIVSGPTLGLMGEYAGARSNPEVIAPLDKLKGMIGQTGTNVNVGGEFRVQGQDLVLALQRADKNRNRII